MQPRRRLASPDGAPRPLATELGPGGSDPAALEAEYNLRLRHPERESVYERLARRSRDLRGRADVVLDVPYGEHPRERLDVFRAARPRGLLVFFHGGYWRALDRSIFSCLAEPFVDAGFSVAMPGYPLAPGSRLHEIVDASTRAMERLAGDAALVGGPELPCFLSGHSAGGHLAAMLAAAGWDGGRAAASVPVSGLFELAPLLGTSVNRELGLDDQTARQASPTRRPVLSVPPTLIVVGSEETAGFRWQSAQYAETLRAAGIAVELEIASGSNHFTILEALADPEDPLHRRVRAFLDAQAARG